MAYTVSIYCTCLLLQLHDGSEALGYHPPASGAALLYGLYCGSITLACFASTHNFVVLIVIPDTAAFMLLAASSQALFRTTLASMLLYVDLQTIFGSWPLEGLFPAACFAS